MPATGRTWLRRWAATATVVVVFAGVLGGQASQAAPRQDLQQVDAQVRDLEMRAASAHEDAERVCERLAEMLAEDPTEFVAQTEAEVSDREASAQQVQDAQAAAAAAQQSASNSGGPPEIAGQSGGSYLGGPRAGAAVQDTLSQVRDPYSISANSPSSWDGKMVSASNPSEGVEVIDFLGPWYREWFSGVGRVLD